MISYEQAKIIVENYVSNLELSLIDDTLVVIETQTIEKPICLDFYLHLQAAFETNNVNFQILVIH
jgi:putative ribosome biogenesis GTPase RsgA